MSSLALKSAYMPQRRTIDDYPDIMQAKHIKEYLGISEALAYQLLHRKGFPTIKITAKRMVVLKASLMEYLIKAEGKLLY